MTKWSSALEVESHPREDGVLIYALSGSLFGKAEGYAFQDAVRGRIGSGESRIVIDLSGIERIDSSGVGILVALMWSASRAGGAMALASIPTRVEKVLDITMLLDHVTHAATLDEAVELVRGMNLGNASR